MSFCASPKQAVYEPNIEHNRKLAKLFPTLKHCGDNSNYNTRSAAKKLMDITLLNKETYGTQPSKYNCIIDWNKV